MAGEGGGVESSDRRGESGGGGGGGGTAHALSLAAASAALKTFASLLRTINRCGALLYRAAYHDASVRRYRS